MLAASLFVADAPQARIVKLPDGSEHPLHFKQLPAAEFKRFLLALRSEDETRQAEAMARLIAASLCEPDGKPALSVKQALALTAQAEKAIGDVVLEINGIGGAAPGKA